MKIKVLALFVFLFLLYTQQSALAQESIVAEISDVYVDKLVSVAKQNYPRYKTYQYRVDMARTNVSIASVSLFDSFSLSYIYQPGTGQVIDPENPSSRLFKGLQLGVFFNIGTLLRAPMNIKRAKQERLIAESEQAEYILTLTNEVKKRYYTYMTSMAQLKLQTRSTQESENSFKDIEYRYKKGEETYDSFNKAQAQLINQRAAKISAEGGAFTAKADLEEILGDKLENIK